MCWFSTLIHYLMCCNNDNNDTDDDSISKLVLECRNQYNLEQMDVEILNEDLEDSEDPEDPENFVIL